MGEMREIFLTHGFMLTKSDLREIGKVVQTSIAQQVGKIVDLSIAQAIEELVNPQFDQVWKEFSTLKSDLTGKMDSIDNRLTRVESQMVTKTYLDDKLADLRADLLGIDKKQEERMYATENILEEKQVFSPDDVAYLHRFDSFK